MEIKRARAETMYIHDSKFGVQCTDFTANQKSGKANVAISFMELFHLHRD
jgi:hypothetical protein